MWPSSIYILSYRCKHNQVHQFLKRELNVLIAFLLLVLIKYIKNEKNKKRAPQTSQKGEQIGIGIGKLQRQGRKPISHTPNMPKLHLN